MEPLDYEISLLRSIHVVRDDGYIGLFILDGGLAGQRSIHSIPGRLEINGRYHDSSFRQTPDTEGHRRSGTNFFFNQLTSKETPVLTLR